MKKPKENAYQAYNRYINGESVGDIAFDLDVSETSIYNMITKVKEFEKWDSVSKITELDNIMHPNWLLAQRQLNNRRKGSVADYYLYAAVLHIYACRVHELFLLRIFGLEEDELQQEPENGYDVELNLYNWKEGKTLTKYPHNVIDAINDMRILHLNDDGHIIDVYDAVTDCDYKKNILRIKLTAKLKESFDDKLPDLKIQKI